MFLPIPTEWHLVHSFAGYDLSFLKGQRPLGAFVGGALFDEAFIGIIRLSPALVIFKGSKH